MNADRMKIQVKTGIIELFGGAKVQDEKYGTVRTGDRIVVDSKSNKVLILGNENKRPQLILPKIPPIGIDRKSSNQ